jgi:hypothetical protein
MAQDPGRGTTILVLGILSLICCALLGPLAWMWGKQDLAKIQAGEIAPEAEQMTKIGMILGIVGTVLLVINVIVGCIIGIMTAIGGFGATKLKTAQTALEVFNAFASAI